MKRPVETDRGTAWVEHHELDIHWVYEEEQSRQMIGTIVVTGREVDDVTFAWSAGEGENAPTGTAASKAEAVAAILEARG